MKKSQGSKKKSSEEKKENKISRRDALKKVGLFSTAAASLFLFSNQYRSCLYDDWYDYYDWYNYYSDWANWWNNPNP
ncbi:MAG: hypothetical protein ACOC5F_04135 [Candidatus Aminicenantaceae bacterium]